MKLLLLGAIAALGSLGHGQTSPIIICTEMVKSKPVVINGLEFTAVTDANWIVTNQGENPAPIQLWITNKTSKDSVFSVFDTFQLVLKNSAGKDLKCSGGRDGTLYVKPVLIHAGDTYCLSRHAELEWNSWDKSKNVPKLCFEDGTGASYVYSPLIAGKYQLLFNIFAKGGGMDDSMKFFAKCEDIPWDTLPFWSGQGSTSEVSFTMADLVH